MEHGLTSGSNFEKVIIVLINITLNLWTEKNMEDWEQDLITYNEHRFWGLSLVLLFTRYVAAGKKKKASLQILTAHLK